MKPTKTVPLIRLQVAKEKEVDFPYANLITPVKAARWMKKFLGDPDRECLVVCAVDTQMCPIGFQVAAIGVRNSCGCTMAEIFKMALMLNATYIIMFHNHPSGDPMPSDEDTRYTNRVKKFGRMIGIPLRDHIILGEGKAFYSYMENGMMKDALHAKGDWGEEDG